MTDTLLFHVDPFGDTRWRVKAPNGEPTLASTEGYVRPEDAFTNAARYLLLEPTDTEDRFVVHTTEELLNLVQGLTVAANAHDFIAVHEHTAQIRRLIQIPGGAR